MTSISRLDDFRERADRPESPPRCLREDVDRLRELCDRIDQLLDAGDLHGARRVSAEARNLSRRLYEISPLPLRFTGTRR